MTEVDRPSLIARCPDRDEHDVGGGNGGNVLGDVQAVLSQRGPQQFVETRLVDWRTSRLDGGYLLRVDVYAKGVKPTGGEGHGGAQPDVPEANDCDARA